MEAHKPQQKRFKMIEMSEKIRLKLDKNECLVDRIIEPLEYELPLENTAKLDAIGELLENSLHLLEIGNDVLNSIPESFKEKTRAELLEDFSQSYQNMKLFDFDDANYYENLLNAFLLQDFLRKTSQHLLLYKN